jgi:hypothetical protein
MSFCIKIRKFLIADVRILSVLDQNIIFQNVVTSPIAEISWSWIVCNNARHRNIRSRGQAHGKRKVPLTADKEYGINTVGFLDIPYIVGLLS